MLKPAQVNKKHCAMSWECGNWEQSVFNAGQREREGKTQHSKGRGTGEASVCSETEGCVYVKATAGEWCITAALSSSTVVPHDLGWVLGWVTDGSPRSFFLVTCLLPASGFVIPLLLTSAVFLQPLISGLWCICSEGGHRDFGWQQMVNLQAATGYTGVKLET